MRAALLIAWKDLRQRIRDRSAFILGILAPLGLALIFSQIIPDFGSGDERLPLLLVDQDGGEIAVEFTGGVLAEVEREGLIELQTVGSVAVAESSIESGAAVAAYVIPEGFSAAVLSGQSATIRVIGDVDAQISTLIAAAIAEAFAGEVTGIQVAVGAAVASGATDLTELAQRASQVPDPVTLVDATADSKVLDANTFFAAGMAIFFLFFTVQFGVSSLLEERTDGTMARLLVAPIRRVSIIGGKGIAAFAVGVVAMVVLVVASAQLIGARWGNPAGVAMLVASSVLAAMGVMALVAAFAKTPEQASNWQAIVAVVLGLLGGTFFPVSQAPNVLANISLLTPHAWFMRGMGELAAGGGPGSVMGAVFAIILFAVVALALASLRLNKMVRA